MSSSNNIHTVETEEASIKFVGSLSTDLSDSDSEEEEQYNNTIDNKTVSNKPLPERNKPQVTKSLKFEENNIEAMKQQTVIVNGDPVDLDGGLNGLSDSKASLDFSQKDGSDVGQNESEKSMSSSNTNFPGNTQHETNIEIHHSRHVDKGETEKNLCNMNSMNSVLKRTEAGSHSRPERFNPFDRDVVFEEDHFSTPESSKTQRDSNSTLSPTPRSGRFSQSLSSVSDSFSLCSHDPADDEFSFADLGLAEDHFSRPEGHFGMSTLEELEMAIENCKEMIREVPQNSERQKTLVRKLVHLRMKYQEYKEGPEPVGPDVRLVVGHRFKEKENRSSKHYCERCNSVIWGVLQAWYRCTECGYHCHEKCLNTITRTCASVKVSENPSYILAICPEKGLAYQNYRCAECRAHISFKSGCSEPRLCDYSGNFYCELCHWNDVMVIPARVLHNWDFQPQKVCRAAKQFLKLMTSKAVLRIQDINPMLFNFVEELDDIKKLREEILVMKKYFLSCKSALESKLLLQLSSRQHCVENSDMYSLRDLMDVHSDVLLPELAKVHSSFAQHIKSDCQLCQAKGFICELCDTHEVLFPFDNIAVVCAQCSYVLHRHCFVKKDNLCPRCERRNKRTDHST